MESFPSAYDKDPLRARREFLPRTSKSQTGAIWAADELVNFDSAKQPFIEGNSLQVSRTPRAMRRMKSGRATDLPCWPTAATQAA